MSLCEPVYSMVGCGGVHVSVVVHLYTEWS